MTLKNYLNKKEKVKYRCYLRQNTILRNLKEFICKVNGSAEASTVSLSGSVDK